MPYLLRQARKSIWTGEEVVLEDRRHAAIGSFARREEDTDGVSIYAIDADGDELLIVAALACQKMEKGKMDLLRLEDAELAQFGSVVAAVGTTPIARANQLHRTLDWPPETLVRLVEHLLASRRASTRFPPRQVLEALLALDAAEVEGGPHRDWVLELKKNEAEKGAR